MLMSKEQRLREQNARKSKKYQTANKAKVLAKNNEWRAANAEYLRAYRKKRRAEKKEELSTKFKEYYARNRERMLERSRQYRSTHVEESRAYDAKNLGKSVAANRRRRTGFTPEDFAFAFFVQGDRCAICGADLLSLPSRCVHADHCHATGALRGVLCQRCNSGLGFFKDDEARLLAAIKYLANPPLALA